MSRCMQKSSTSILSTILLAVLLSGCAAKGAGGLAANDRATTMVNQISMTDRHLEFVITDLVSGMVQIDELSPYTTTLQVSAPIGKFGLKLLQALEGAGYGMQQVSADQGVNYLAYANRVTVTEGGRITDFVVSVGGISLRREYDLVNGRIFPASFMFITGSTSSGDIVLNKNIFLQQGGDLVFKNGVELVSPDSTLVFSELHGSLTDLNTQTAEVEQQAELQKAKEQVLAIRDQSFSETQVIYNPLRRVEFVFADDTLQLGRGNKSAVRQMIREFVPETDVLNVISCRFNQSDSEEQVKNRSRRVKEEFILHGLSARSVVEEGCLSAEYPGSAVSERTVVLIQRRMELVR